MQATARMVSEVKPVVPLSREAMVRAARLIAPVRASNMPMVEIMSAPAAWTVFIDGSGLPLPMPRLRSLRRRGIAPPYPRPARFEGVEDGTIILFQNGLVLEPKDRRHPCINLGESSVLAATFYRDAFEVWISARERLLVRTEPVEQVDSVFQAYFWNPTPYG